MTFQEKIMFAACTLAFVFIACAVVMTAYKDNGLTGGLIAAGISIVMGVALMSEYLESLKEREKAATNKKKSSHSN